MTKEVHTFFPKQIIFTSFCLQAKKCDCVLRVNYFSWSSKFIKPVGGATRSPGTKDPWPELRALIPTTAPQHSPLPPYCTKQMHWFRRKPSVADTDWPSDPGARTRWHVSFVAPTCNLIPSATLTSAQTENPFLAHTAKTAICWYISDSNCLVTSRHTAVHQISQRSWHTLSAFIQECIAYLWGHLGVSSAGKPLHDDFKQRSWSYLCWTLFCFYTKEH